MDGFNPNPQVNVLEVVHGIRLHVTRYVTYVGIETSQLIYMYICGTQMYA